MAATTKILRWFLFLWLCFVGIQAAETAQSPEVHPKDLGRVSFDGIQYFADSDVVLLQTFDDTTAKPIVLWRSENGGQDWHEVEKVEEAVQVIMHPFDSQVAFALSSEQKYWITHDRGKSWDEHKLKHHLAWWPDVQREILSFHTEDPKKIIFNAIKIDKRRIYEEAYYSKDGVDKPGHLKELLKDTRGCSWVQGTPEFKAPDDEDVSDRILCKVMGKSSFDFDQRLLVSDDFFKTKTEPVLENGRTMQGVIDVAHTKGYLVTAARSENTDEIAMFVSSNGSKWHQAEFAGNHKLTETSYTILESTNYSLQVAVTRSDGMTTLMSSNSDGTYFTEDMKHLRKNQFSFVDFEKVLGFQGVILVNTEEGDVVKSFISFHDGKTIRAGNDGGKSTWHELESGDEELHLHSVTDKRMRGRVYSSAAPGVLMGIGNTGKSLGNYHDDGHLYVSNDAGHTWEKKLDGPHKYAFGDHGNILIAISDTRDGAKGAMNGKYSTNHGKDWFEFDIDKGNTFTNYDIFTDTDSSSRKFLITASVESGHRFIYSIDFDKILPDKCTNDDFEPFKALLEDDKLCVMGHRQVYRRRKQDARCFVREDFVKLEPESEPCPCTDADFECKHGFKPDNGKCVYVSSPHREVCENKDTFVDESGFQKIPGNRCKGGSRPDEKVERPCSEAQPKPQVGIPETEKTPFERQTKIQVVTLGPSRSSQDKTETVYVLTEDKKKKTRLYKSSDHGKVFNEILKGETVLEIFRHPYNTDAVFIATESDKVFYSYSRGRDMEEYFKVDSHWNQLIHRAPFSFHQDKRNMFIWMGTKKRNCDIQDEDCQVIAQYTTDRGKTWDLLKSNIRKCDFIEREGRETTKEDESSNRLFCSVYKHGSKDQLRLLRTDDFFESQNDDDHLLENIVQYETSSEFVVAAGQDEDGLLYVNASVFGGDFAAAKFPPRFSTHHDSFTVLQSQTHAVMLFATVQDKKNLEFGRVLKSNSNGTSYVTNIDRVNRNAGGYVDFKPVEGLEGVSIVNVVINAEDDEGGKLLQTRITHNDGANWAALDIPEHGKAGDGHSYDCVRKQESCKLHFHGYTTDEQPHASRSAVGILIGTGNVGEYLDQTGEKDATFVSNDGGLSWKEARSGRHLWAYGDQGSIIVLVPNGNSGRKTDTLWWSSDEGQTWVDYQFDKQNEVSVLDLTTVPSGNSKSFLIWGQDGDHTVAYSIDFSKTRDHDCKLDKEHIEDETSDYRIWSPKHPKQIDTGCFLGHKLEYYRKRPEKVCWNGPLLGNDGLNKSVISCECIRQDFECDYNYEMNLDGECILVPGLDPPDHSQACRDNTSLIQYFEPTGHRRIPMDTCSGGRDLEFVQSRAHPCPGHEPEFEDLHRGLTGFAFFLVVVFLPISVAAGVGYWIFRRWDGKFGAIRLGETSSDNVLDTDKPWVKYPIVALSAVVAVILAIPSIMTSAFRSVQPLFSKRSGRYTTRASFARNRGEYMPVDEEELLGDDEDEEI